MTSQQAAAILFAAGIGSPHPTLFTDTDDEYAQALAMFDVRLERSGEWRRERCSGGPFDAVEYGTTNGYVTVMSPTRPPIAALAAPIADSDRVYLTDAGREAVAS